MNAWHLKQATRAILAGGVIAYPTEAVWGLGCDPHHRGAVERLLALKQRPLHKGLILIAASMDQLAPLVDSLSSEQLRELEQSWPGPVTWLLPDPQDWTPSWVRGSHASVAVRVSAHPVVRALCKQVGGPLVSTSANRTGEPEARTQQAVRLAFASQLDYLLPGPLGGQQRPSEIRDLLSGRVLRAG